MIGTTRPETKPISYPDGDGKPMAETDKHRDLAVYVIETLKAHFRDRPDVYISGNNFVYWQEGNAKARVSPDAYIVFGVGMEQRDRYLAWQEGGHSPDVVFEFTSKSTRREDTDTKRPLYERTLRVPEYFLFDPTGDYLRPRLQGYRLMDDRYHPLEMVDGRLYSERLGLFLQVSGAELRLFDPISQRVLLTPVEQAQRADAEARLAEAERLRAEAERARAEAETRRAESETRRAEAEALARRDAESEMERLRAELAALKERTTE